MLQFLPDYLDNIKRLVPVSTIVGRSVELKRQGKEHVGLCPFHVEKTASFTVNDDKQFYHCFGCGAHGDVIKWVMEHTGQRFADAVRVLASEAGMGPPAQLDAQRAAQARREGEERRRRETESQERERKERGDQAARIVIERLTRCESKFHTYLEGKGFPELHVPVSPNGWLMIPIWNREGEIRSAQYISPDGEKLFQPGSEIKGNFHRLGRHREIWLCEGYATGLSIRDALRRRSLNVEIRICFSASNVLTVGLDAIEAWRTVFSIPDHDRWSCRNRHRWDGSLTMSTCPECGETSTTPPAGESSAVALKKPYWLPPEVGQDANDYAQANGVDALATALRDFRFGDRMRTP